MASAALLPTLPFGDDKEIRQKWIEYLNGFQANSLEGQDLEGLLHVIFLLESSKSNIYDVANSNTPALQELRGNLTDNHTLRKADIALNEAIKTMRLKLPSLAPNPSDSADLRAAHLLAQTLSEYYDQMEKLTDIRNNFRGELANKKINGVKNAMEALKGRAEKLTRDYSQLMDLRQAEPLSPGLSEIFFLFESKLLNLREKDLTLVGLMETERLSLAPESKELSTLLAAAKASFEKMPAGNVAPHGARRAASGERSPRQAGSAASIAPRGAAGAPRAPRREDFSPAAAAAPAPAAAPLPAVPQPPTRERVRAAARADGRVVGAGRPVASAPSVTVAAPKVGVAVSQTQQAGAARWQAQVIAALKGAIDEINAFLDSIKGATKSDSGPLPLPDLLLQLPPLISTLQPKLQALLAQCQQASAAGTLDPNGPVVQAAKNVAKALVELSSAIFANTDATLAAIDKALVHAGQNQLTESDQGILDNALSDLKNVQDVLQQAQALQKQLAAMPKEAGYEETAGALLNRIQGQQTICQGLEKLVAAFHKRQADQRAQAGGAAGGSVAAAEGEGALGQTVAAGASDGRSGREGLEPFGSVAPSITMVGSGSFPVGVKYGADDEADEEPRPPAVRQPEPAMVTRGIAVAGSVGGPYGGSYAVESDGDASAYQSSFKREDGGLSYVTPDSRTPGGAGAGAAGTFSAGTDDLSGWIQTLGGKYGVLLGNTRNLDKAFRDNGGFEETSLAKDVLEGASAECGRCIEDLNSLVVEEEALLGSIVVVADDAARQALLVNFEEAQIVPNRRETNELLLQLLWAIAKKMPAKINALLRDSSALVAGMRDNADPARAEKIMHDADAMQQDLEQHAGLIESMQRAAHGLKYIAVSEILGPLSQALVVGITKLNDVKDLYKAGLAKGAQVGRQGWMPSLADATTDTSDSPAGVARAVDGKDKAGDAATTRAAAQASPKPAAEAPAAPARDAAASAAPEKLNVGGGTFTMEQLYHAIEGSIANPVKYGALHQQVVSWTMVDDADPSRLTQVWNRDGGSDGGGALIPLADVQRNCPKSYNHNRFVLAAPEPTDPDATVTVEHYMNQTDRSGARLNDFFNMRPQDVSNVEFMKNLALTMIHAGYDSFNLNTLDRSLLDQEVDIPSADGSPIHMSAYQAWCLTAAHYKLIAMDGQRIVSNGGFKDAKEFKAMRDNLDAVWGKFNSSSLGPPPAYPLGSDKKDARLDELEIRTGRSPGAGA